MEVVRAMDGIPSKGLIFNVFDGGNFTAWSEEIMLVLMAMGLWEIVYWDETGTEKEEEGGSKGRKLAWKPQQVYAIISLYLALSCRDCIRHLGDCDPRKAWEAVQKRFGQPTAATKIILLDKFLNLRCALNDEILRYVSEFNELINRLAAHKVVFWR